MGRGAHQRRRRWSPHVSDGLVAVALATAVILALSVLLGSCQDPPRAGADPTPPAGVFEPPGPHHGKPPRSAAVSPLPGAQPAPAVRRPRNRAEAVSARSGGGLAPPATVAPTTTTRPPPAPTTTTRPKPKPKPTTTTGPPVEVCVVLPPLATCLEASP